MINNIFHWSCRGCGQSLRCTVLQRGSITIKCPECEHVNAVPESRTEPVYNEWQKALKEQERILGDERKAKAKELKGKLKETRRAEREAAKNEPEIITRQGGKKIQRDKKKKARRRAGLFRWVIVWVVISCLLTTVFVSAVHLTNRTERQVADMTLKAIAAGHYYRLDHPFTVEMFEPDPKYYWVSPIAGLIIGLFLTFLFRIFIGVIRMLI